MKIGTVELANPFFLAPLAGISDLPFRILCHEQGCGLTYTEMISAKALYYRNAATEKMLVRDPEEGPCAVQLFGSEPGLMGDMAAEIQERFELIDVNMGCPVPKVVNNGEGSALMKNPELIHKIVADIVSKVNKPVTVKIRKGFDEGSVNAVEAALAAQEGGASAVAVHGRTRAQYYTGRSDRGIIRQVKEALEIPVIGNGDIFRAEDAISMMEETGCDAVMIARGARGNPWIFRSALALSEGKILPPDPSAVEIADEIRKHAALLIEYKGMDVAMREMRKHLAWYTAGFPHAAALRGKANYLESEAQLEEWLKEFACYEEGRKKNSTRISDFS